MKINFKNVLPLFFLSAFLLLAGCGEDEAANGETNNNDGNGSSDTHELVIAHNGEKGLSWTLGIEKFAELAEEYADGKLDIKIYDSGQLGSQEQVLESIELGTVDMTYVFEPLTQWVPEIGVYNFLFLFDSVEHLRTVDEGEVGQELKELVKEKAGMRVLMSYLRDGRQLTTNNPIESVDDVKGLKIRVAGSNVVTKSWEAMGATPVPMPMNEVFSALQQGVIEGQENPMSIINARNIYEVNDHVALTNHQFSPVWVLISEEKYQGFPEDVQDAIQRASEEAQEYEFELAEEEWAEQKSILEEQGVTFTNPDVSGFREAVESVYEEYPEYESYIKKIKEAK
ncbi:TRAP transporter substrate-binding protein [Thalassobacillus devorans]|uniref:TRAP transporter substrate-binding protein n=1 Tax=Thalassobacillus devorans TaxID=279813 RepID=UPI001594387A|nr:TRAP transporter substrate-binding protein [Thalassobacillus devorans]